MALSPAARWHVAASTSRVTADKLNDVMEFDHVIRVNADGTIDHDPQSWAPELRWESDSHVLECHPTYGPGWALLNGYSGQDGYRGPIMHASEFIGGGMARDILATPGLYVALVCEVHDCEECLTPDGEEITDPECGGEHEPAGWAVAYIAD